MKKSIKASLFTAFVIGFSACSSTANLSEITPLENLTMVNNIRTLQGMREIGFEWDPIYDQAIDGYKIYRRVLNDETSTDKLIATINDRYATHYSDNNLTPDTAYAYTFATFNKQGLSKLSTINVKTINKIEPVSFIQAIAGLPNKIKIIWRPHTDSRVVKYNIYKQDANSSKWYKLATVNNRLSAEYLDDVKPNLYAKYKVTALTYNGVESDASTEVEAISKILPPQIVNINVTTNLPKKIILTWDAPKYDDFSHYKIYYSKASLLPFFELATTTDNSYEDNVADDGVSRYYYVTMIDKDGLESAKTGVNVVGMSLDKPKAPALTGFELQNENTLKIKWISTDNRIKTYKLIKNSAEVASNIQNDYYIDTTYLAGDVYQVIGIDEFGIESKASAKLSVK